MASVGTTSILRRLAVREVATTLQAPNIAVSKSLRAVVEGDKVGCLLKLQRLDNATR